MSDFLSLQNAIASDSILNEVIVVNQVFSPNISTEKLRIVVFNIERGFGLEPLLIYLREHPLLKNTAVILANEVDWGMKRTENRNIAALIAEKNGFNYAYGIEFAYLKTPDSENTEGLHGNVIFSRLPILESKVIRLPSVYNWQHSEQPRSGSRNAVCAAVEWKGKKIGLSSAHLENRTTPDGRLKQMKCLLEGVEAFFGNIPVIIGGDMNTNCMNGADNNEALILARNPAEQKRRIREVEKIEPLLRYAAQHGFDYTCCNLIDKTTRRKPIQGEKDLLLNLDWFFARGFIGTNPHVITAIFDENKLETKNKYAEWQGTQISDHDAIVADFCVF